MPGPGYPWTCTKCRHPNVATADSCTACGCPAVVAPIDIEPPASRSSEALFPVNQNWFGLAFPEWLIAGAFVICAPPWAIALLFRGLIFHALFLLGGVGIFGYVALNGLRSGKGGIAYAGMLGILATGAIVILNT